VAHWGYTLVSGLGPLG